MTNDWNHGGEGPSTPCRPSRSMHAAALASREFRTVFVRYLSYDDVTRAITGLKQIHSKGTASLHHTTLQVRSALAGFRGRTGIASSVATTGNYNVQGAFIWSSGAAGDAASPWEVFVNGFYDSSNKDATPLAMASSSTTSASPAA